MPYLKRIAKLNENSLYLDSTSSERVISEVGIYISIILQGKREFDNQINNV